MSNAAMTNLFVLGSMAFTLVTVVLYTLAHQMGSAINRHDLIRNARLQQQAYLDSLAERRRGANADYDEINVDILDDAGTTAGSFPGTAPGSTHENATENATRLAA